MKCKKILPYIQIILMIVMFLLVLTLGINWISAQNETCTGDSCNIDEVNLTNTEANCTEQLKDVIYLYNNLTEDYHAGANCGTVRYLLIDNNAKLSDGLKECNQELGENKMYKIGFYFLFGVMIIVAVYWIYLGHKGGKNGSN